MRDVLCRARAAKTKKTPSSRYPRSRIRVHAIDAWRRSIANSIDAACGSMDEAPCDGSDAWVHPSGPAHAIDAWRRSIANSIDAACGSSVVGRRSSVVGRRHCASRCVAWRRGGARWRAASAVRWRCVRAQSRRHPRADAHRHHQRRRRRRRRRMI